MQLFEVKKTQEALKIKDSMKIGEFIEQNKDRVYLIIDDDRQEIWLYKGNSSSIAEQFIGIQMQKLMKLQFRGFYHTEDLNAISKEDEKYKKIMNSKIKEGKAKEIIQETADNKESELSETQMRIKAEIDIDKSRARETCIHKDIIPKNILPELRELENPENFHRHMAIVANGVYTEEMEIDKFLTENSSRKELRKVGTLPNGFFFVEGVSTRLIIKRGKVECIDLMMENDKFLGETKLVVPLFFKEKLHRPGNMKNLLNAFQKPDSGEELNSE